MDPTGFNFTEEPGKNYTRANSSYEIFEEDGHENCDEYCNGHMRYLVEEYKEHYHGYVTLAVSIFNKITWEMFSKNPS